LWRSQGTEQDPIKLIQTMIHESHYKLTEEVEDLLMRYENKLRQDIKEVLRRHAAGLDLRVDTPLDQRRVKSPSPTLQK
jgi:uncharacterized protein YajQ (UPF0234 family)